MMKKIAKNEIVSAIIVVGFILAGVILLKDSKPPVKVEDTNSMMGDYSYEAGLVRPVAQNEHITGNPDAKVVIVEYSDLECPFCKVFHSTMLQIIDEKGDDVAWVYRHYPIPLLHQKAFREAEATECAWDQGGNEVFWAYTDRIFDITPSNDGLEESDLRDIAEFVGLDMAEFENCLASGKFTAKVQADIDAGTSAGVTGTPSSFIFVDGELVDTIPGAEPYAQVKQKIERALRM